MEDRAIPSDEAEAGMGAGLAWTLALGLLTATFLLDAWYLVPCGNGLSPYADAYSEANSLRAGERFAKDGFLVNAGLPDVTYGGRYRGVGIRGASGGDHRDTIYHGYPPGSDWLAGVYIRLFGVEHVGRFRWLPLAFGMIAATVLLGSLWRALGPVRGLLVYLACLATPMFTNVTHGLYYHGYALNLLLLELAILLWAHHRTEGRGLGWVTPAAIGTVGFAQGWFSFDYSFLVTFAPLPMAILLASGGIRSIAWRRAFGLVLAAGLGFTAAHGLHFLQSVAYFGSLRGALDEYAFRANKMYSLSKSGAARASKLDLIVAGLKLYALSYVRWTRICSPASIGMLALTAMVLALRGLSLTARGMPIRVDLEFRPKGLHMLGLVTALGVSLGWLFAKPFHALNHIPFSGRHLFLFYFASCLMVAQVTRARVVQVSGVDPQDLDATSSHAQGEEAVAVA